MTGGQFVKLDHTLLDGSANQTVGLVQRHQKIVSQRTRHFKITLVFLLLQIKSAPEMFQLGMKTNQVFSVAVRS